MAQQISTNTFGVAKWIVSPTLSNGTHTTITSAMASASSGDTIFVRDGTYTENFTMTAGVNLCALNCDAITPNVTISGKVTFSNTGTSTISGICLQTNSDYCIVCSGSNAVNTRLINCFINATNNTAISYTNSNNASLFYLYYCRGDITTNGYAYFEKSSSGKFKFNHVVFLNEGASTTTCTLSGNGLDINNSIFLNSINNSGSTEVNIENSLTQNFTASSAAGFAVDNSSIGTLTHTGTGTSYLTNCNLTAGSSSAISVGAGCTVNANLCAINSSNTNAITGAGTLNYGGLSFTGSSSLINVTTQVGGVLQGGKFQAPSAGFIGERFMSTGTVTLSTGTPLTVCSITMTPGIYDVTGMCDFAGTVTGTNFTTSISTTNNALGGASGDNQLSTPIGPTAASNSGLSIIVSRATVTTNTTYYLVSKATFTVGTLTANGKICATRVA